MRLMESRRLLLVLVLLLLPSRAGALSSQASPTARAGYWELASVHAEPLGGSQRVIHQAPEGAWRLFVSASEDGGEAQALFEPASQDRARGAERLPPALARWLLTWTPPPTRLAPGETWSARIATSAGGTVAPSETIGAGLAPIPKVRAEYILVAHRRFTDVVLGTLWERGFVSGAVLEAPATGSASMPITWTVPGWAPVLESYATRRDQLPVTIRITLEAEPRGPGSSLHRDPAEVALTWRYRWVDLSETVDVAVRAAAASHAAAADAGYRVRAPEPAADRHNIFVLLENRGGAHPVREVQVRAWDGRPGDPGSRALGDAVAVRDVPPARQDDRFAWVTVPLPLARPLEEFDLWVEATVPSQVDLDHANNARGLGRVRIRHLRREGRAFAIPADAHSFAAFPAPSSTIVGIARGRWIDARGLPTLGPAMVLAAAEAFLGDPADSGTERARARREPTAIRSRTQATPDLTRAAALLESAASTAPPTGSWREPWSALEQELAAGRPGLLLVDRHPRTVLLLAYKLVEEEGGGPRRTVYVHDPEWPSERLGLRPDPYVSWLPGIEVINETSAARARAQIRRSAPEYVSWTGETEAWAAWPIGQLLPRFVTRAGMHATERSGTARIATSGGRAGTRRGPPPSEAPAAPRYTAPDGSYSFPLPAEFRPTGRNPRGDLDMFHARDSGPFLHASRGARAIENGSAGAWWDQAARMLEEAYGRIDTRTLRADGREARVFGYPSAGGTYTVWQAHVSDGNRMVTLTWGERTREGTRSLPEAFAALLRDLTFTP